MRQEISFNTKIFSFEDAQKYCSRSKSESDARGPRPALFQGIVGKSHKKSIEMQKKNSHSSKTMPTGKLAAIGQKLNFRPTFPGLQSFGSFSKAALTALISLTLIVFFCYPSAQTYYIQERKTQQLTAVQAAITERNEQVQKNVDALNTDEGIEASAHQEFGYVKDGEGSAIVQGVETESSSKMIQYVDANTITAPSTWYNNILDVIFGYDNTPKK